MSQGGMIGSAYQPNPYGQRSWGQQSFGGGNPWMRQSFGNKMGQPPLGDPSQFSNPGMATPQNSVTTGIRGQSTPPAWIAPPGGMNGPPAMQPRTQPQMSDSFVDSGFTPQQAITQSQPSGAVGGGTNGPQTPSWYNSSMGPAEHYNLQKFPWLAHINGPDSAPPPQGWNAYAPGSEGYRTVFNPNRGQQLYPNQPWMWPFAGASNSPLR